MLYFGIGKYISLNSRKGFWGKGDVDAISEKLQRQLPGLRGYSSRNLRNMRQFYEEWSILESERDTYDNLAVTSAKIDDPDELKAINPIWQLQLPKQLARILMGMDSRWKLFYLLVLRSMCILLQRLKTIMSVYFI